MMQMLNAIAEPINAMIVSKEGTRIAKITITAIVKTRMKALMRPRVQLNMPKRPVVRGTSLADKPIKDSRVMFMGLTLSAIS